MARLGYEGYEANFQKMASSDSFMYAFSSLAESIMSLLTMQMKPILVNRSKQETITNDAVVAVWNQIKLIRNRDTVLQIVCGVADSPARAVKRNKKMWEVSV